MSGKKIALLLGIILLVSATFWPFTSTAQIREEYYSEQTGHYIRDDFYQKYFSAENPLKVYGYPITDQFTSQAAGLMVQYFQRARFELHPENPPSQRVIVSPLGLYMLDINLIKPLNNLPPKHPACRYFSETDYQICYSFLNFFDENGGLEQFGFPISEIVEVDGRVVQYFERARFEWHPEFAPGQRVTLTNIGQLVFNQTEDPGLLIGSAKPAIPSNISDLKVRAFPGRATLAPNENQTIYAVVLDQQWRPVQNAEVNLTITFANQEEIQLVQLTNVSGIAEFTFAQNNKPIGIVKVDVQVIYGAKVKFIEKFTRTSYRNW